MSTGPGQFGQKDRKKLRRRRCFEWWACRCAYCDAPATSLDHMDPKGRFRNSRQENMVPACDPCNNRKGSQTAEQFLAGQPERMLRIFAWQGHVAAHQRTWERLERKRVAEFLAGGLPSVVTD